MGVARLCSAWFVATVATVALAVEPVEVRFGVSGALSMHPVSSSDLQASWEICIEAVAEDWNGPVTRYVSMLAANDSAAQAAAIEAERLNVIALSAIEFLELSQRIPIAALLSPVLTTGAAGIVFGLVKRRSLGSLQGARCVRFGTGLARLGELWLRHELVRMNLPPPDRCFRSVKTLDSGSRVILETFFDSADVCVVPLMDFETMVELNPAVGRELEVVACSPRFLTGVLAVLDGCKPSLRKGLTTVMVRERYRPQLEQLFTLFRITKLVPFEDGHLDTLRRLIAGSAAPSVDETGSRQGSLPR